MHHNRSIKSRFSQAEIQKISFRFWTKAAWVGNCLVWTGGKDKDGYGKFSIFNFDYRASRLAYELFYGEYPDQLVLHTCDNPGCVNPEHLMNGNQRENITQMNLRGRRNPPDTRGVRSSRAKLTEDQVLAIRASDKTKKELATEYGVSYGCIDHIIRRINWKHV